MAWLSTWCVNNQPRYEAHDTETAAIEHAKTMRAWRMVGHPLLVRGQRGDSTMSNGPIEPSADMRQTAAHLRDMYVALTLEGFTATEALTIIGHVLAGNHGGQA